MLHAAQLERLMGVLSHRARVLSDPSSSEFQERIARWSKTGLQVPGAIVMPKSEIDCSAIVRWATSTNIPFVCKAGGMSLYSTVDQNGIVIDLEDMASIQYDHESRCAVLVGGISSKAVAAELAKHGRCTTLPASNTVGAIPFFLNGGNSPLVSSIGYASDNIISASIVTATGELLNVSETGNADLLYAIRGAGQYFGLVVSLIVATFPVSDVFGNERGEFWSGRFVFPIERAKEVGTTMELIVNDSNHCTGGLIMVAAPPPAHQPAVVVVARLIRPNSGELQRIVFQQLYELKPLASGGGLIPIENQADALQPLMAFGDFKKLRLTGIYSYDASMLPEIAEVWQELATECPDAIPSMFSIQWESRLPRPSRFDSANEMHDIRLWANNLTWCTKSESVSVAERYLDKVIAVTRKGQNVEEYVDFANSLRGPESPIERRYKNTSTLQRLRDIKRRWDPEAVFSKEFF